MKVAVAGASGFVGSHLVPRLVEEGHEVVTIDRREPRYSKAENWQVDLRERKQLEAALEEADAVYYLVHGMTGQRDFGREEKETAEIFREACETEQVEHLVYLSGIVNNEASSEHLSSRKQVGEILQEGEYGYTELRAAMILGDGSASFEMMRDTVERLPIIPLPRWLDAKSQPIYVEDAVEYLVAVLDVEEARGRKFDIGGPGQLSYGEILKRYSKLRNLKRFFVPIPLLTPRIVSLGVGLVTDQDYSLASGLFRSLGYDLLVENPFPEEIMEQEPLSFEEAVREIEDGTSRKVIMKS